MPHLKAFSPQQALVHKRNPTGHAQVLEEHMSLVSQPPTAFIATAAL